MAEDLVVLMNAARAVVAENLPQIASEILAWNNTGLLPEGKLREVAAILAPISTHDALGIAEKIARDAAYEAAAAEWTLDPGPRMRRP